MRKLLVVSASLIASMVWADKVTFKSGSFLTGKSGIIEGNKLVFASDDLGEVKIDIANIKSLEEASTHVVQFNDNTRVEKNLTFKDGAIMDGEQKLDMASVKAIDPSVETWHGSVNLAFNAARGNTYDNTAAVVANVNRRWEKDRVTADFGYYYGENGKIDSDTRQKTTDRWEIEGKHDHFWWEKVYSYENLKWERDVIQELNARYRLGLGGGYQWLDGSSFTENSGKWSFNQEVGANWIKEDYKNNDDEKADGFCALRYAHHLTWVPSWVSGFEAFHNAEILPDVGDWEKFLAKADIGFTTKVVYNFDLLAKIEWDYNSMPANDRKRSDYRYIIGLGYKW